MTGSDQSAGASRLDLREYLDLIEETLPADVVHVTEVVNPAKFEVTAVLHGA